MGAKGILVAALAGVGFAGAVGGSLPGVLMGAEVGGKEGETLTSTPMDAPGVGLFGEPAPQLAEHAASSSAGSLALSVFFESPAGHIAM